MTEELFLQATVSVKNPLAVGICSTSRLQLPPGWRANKKESKYEPERTSE